MPIAANLVLNNGAATPVSKTFTLLTPASGYGSIAEWALKEGSISTVFPRITIAARKTANGSAKATVKVRVPSSYTDSVTGITKVSSAFEINMDITVPDTFPESLKNDAVAFCQNLVGNSLMAAVLRDATPVV